MLRKNKITELLYRASEKRMFEDAGPFSQIITGEETFPIESKCSKVVTFEIKFQTVVTLQEPESVNGVIRQKIVDHFWSTLYGDIYAELNNIISEIPYRIKEDLSKELQKLREKLKGEQQ